MAERHRGGTVLDRLPLASGRRPKPIERVINVWDLLRTSLWFVPAVLVALAALSALLLRVADGASGRLDASLPLVYSGTAEDASALLSTLLSSMITMVSLVFSMTLIVLTLAANQFGPRLIRIFMADRRTQLVLGVFVATIVYLLLVLLQVGQDRPVPRLSVTAAIPLSLANVCLLLFFIHNLARSIVAETIIERVGTELDETIRRLLPIGSGPEPHGERDRGALPDDLAERARPLGLPRTGYVQAVEYEQLVRLAAAHDVLVVLRFRAGDYVIEGGRRVFVYPAERCSRALADAIDAALLVGHHRTPTQDIEFSIRHLVEIALRALSPSLNDAYTAVAVIDRLGASLALLMRQTLEPEVCRDERGRIRVVGEAPSYAGICGAAFHQIRQSGRSMPAVIIRLLNTITRVAEHVRLDEQREVLLHHVRLIADDGVRAAASAADAADIRETQRATERTLRQSPDSSPEQKAKAEWFA